MTFRSLAALTFSGGAILLLSALALFGEAPGVSEPQRHLREMKARLDEPRDVRRWSIDDFRSLPHGRPLAEYAPFERRGVSLEGWVQRTMLAGDGDMHLEVAPTRRRPAGRDTVYVSAEITPGWRHRDTNWSFDALNAVFRPNAGAQTAWDAGPRRVRVTGWLLYDFQYDRLPSSWTLQYAAPRLTGWEIHPVTKLERWDDARAAWIEVPR